MNLIDKVMSINAEDLLNNPNAKSINLNEEDDKKREMDNQLFVLLLEKYKINPFSNLSVQDVARDLGMNQNSANKLFKRDDFPSLNFTKPKQVCVLAYYLWKLERRN